MKLRGWLLLLSGLAIVGHETLASCGRPRLELLIFAQLLCGLPITFKVDDALRSRSQRQRGRSSARSRSS